MVNSTRRPYTRRPLWDRFWEKVDADGDCWEWVGSKYPGGYGRISEGSVYRCAHRVVWELLVGPIPDGLTIDHLCRNHACVNPDHLEPVPLAENIRRGFSISSRNRARTSCPRGHSYDEANTYVDPRGSRQCRACHMAGESRRRFALRTLAALTAALTFIASPAFAHSRAELDRWQADWSTRAEPALTVTLVAERADMIARHPCQIVACASVVAAVTINPSDPTPTQASAGVEAWGPLVARFFPASTVDAALGVMDCESRGNPAALNASSGAAGLFQFLPSTWANTPLAAESPFDPVANIAAAAWLSDGGSNWSQWSCQP